ncbi:hypothetical protein QR680_004966 [Steinernema hermaphroditum]|uniref:Rho-GAP domain-containing protein n=1 Tax=Steinernema hermaphroditum TaxID=289476 RepID=A0AA39LUI7_9BILA|nr:hypothetical protein QR680_004966 [Steinernema hermaphroditum]
MSRRESRLDRYRHGKKIKLREANARYVGEDVIVRNAVEVPRFLSDAFTFLEERKYQLMECVFRKEGQKSRMRTCFEKIALHGENFNAVAKCEGLTVHDVCGMIKNYLRLLEKPLLAGLENVACEHRDSLEVLRLMNSLDPYAKTTLAYLMTKLNDLVQKSDTNKMDERSLAVVFTPCLFGDISEEIFRIEDTMVENEKRASVIRWFLKNCPSCITSSEFTKTEKLKRVNTTSEQKRKSSLTRVTEMASSVARRFGRSCSPWEKSGKIRTEQKKVDLGRERPSSANKVLVSRLDRSESYVNQMQPRQRLDRSDSHMSRRVIPKVAMNFPTQNMKRGEIAMRKPNEEVDGKGRSVSRAILARSKRSSVCEDSDQCGLMKRSGSSDLTKTGTPRMPLYKLLAQELEGRAPRDSVCLLRAKGIVTQQRREIEERSHHDG